MTMSDAVIQQVRIVDARADDTGFHLTSPVPPAAVDAPLAPLAEDSSADLLRSTEAYYAQGLEDGQRLAECEFEAERSQFKALIASASALLPEPSEELAVLISETVERLVTEIVGSAPIDRDWLATHARRAAALVAQCDSARTMWLNADDIALIEACEIGLPLMVDENAARGTIRIDCSASWIEHGTALYLEELRSELGLKGGPS